jgi:hypothetical protein
MGVPQQTTRFLDFPQISKFKMAPIQWESMQFYQPPLTTVPSSRFWPPSSHNSKAPRAGSTYLRPSEVTLLYEEVKRTATHGAAQQSTTSSSGQVELPPSQGPSLHTAEAWDEGTSPCSFITSTADQVQKSPRITNTIEMQLMSATRRRNFPRLKNYYCPLRRTAETSAAWATTSKARPETLMRASETAAWRILIN